MEDRERGICEDDLVRKIEKSFPFLSRYCIGRVVGKINPYTSGKKVKKNIRVEDSLNR